MKVSALAKIFTKEGGHTCTKGGTPTPGGKEAFHSFERTNMGVCVI